MFGSMQLENQFGIVKEPGKESEAWKVLKYLLVKRGITVSQEEMMEAIWPGMESTKNAYFTLRARLSRIRAALEDIKLGGKKGLVLCDNGLFDLNPECNIQTDADCFDLLIEQIKHTPADEHKGIMLCAQALTLYRGDFLGKTPGAWLEAFRAHYRGGFEYLVQTTLERMKVLQDTTVLSILRGCAASLMPENGALREEIDRLAAERKKPNEIRPIKGRAVQPEKVMRRSAAPGGDIKNSEHSVRVRIFGPVELENRFGRAREVPGQQSQPWLMLKYLLANQGREASHTELLSQIWGDSRIDTEGNGDGAARVYLNRLRQILKPLQLDGKNGLIGFSAGYYSLNPNFELNADMDLFWILMDKIRIAPFGDPNGLVLCVEALELFRGKVMENTEESPWLRLIRENYNEAFCFLACSTLERMETLNDHAAIELLSQRALKLVPEEEELQWEIIAFMAKQGLEEELLHHITQWVRVAPERQEESGGRETPEAELMDIEGENAVAVSLFGSVELKNPFGCAVENPEQPSEAWTFLKYLLINRDRELSEEELGRALLSDAAQCNEKNTLQIRWRRARQLLQPLQLGGVDELLLHGRDTYGVNPAYEIQTDEDMFRSLMNEIRQTPEDDPDGLKACVKALTIYRGAFLQYTKDAAWLVQRQKHYHREFCYLAHNTLRRMTALGDAAAVGLLGRRVAAMMPEAEDLHANLVSFMMGQDRRTELEEFVSRLVRGN